MSRKMSTSGTGQQEIVTGTLAAEQIRSQIAETARLLHSAGVEKIMVEYGWGCNLKPAELWQSVEIEVTSLEQFAGDAERIGTYRVGAADLIVTDASGNFQILFCHESDIHFKATDSTLLLRVKQLWQGHGIVALRKTTTGEWLQA